MAPEIKMKAILHKEFGGPEVLGVTNDVEIPQIEKHEVLIQVHAAGINRPDILQRSGGYPPPPGASEILGLEVSGEIVDVGEDDHGDVDDDVNEYALQVKWATDNLDGYLNFYSVSGDGRFNTM